jgi:hypothetical protein
MDADKTNAWISTERFAPFLERTDGDWALALDLYLWHARIAGASLTTLHHFEVALRNAIDRQLRGERPQTPIERSWLLDQATLSPHGIAKVRDVLARLKREGYPREHPHVIAALPFSFWKGLFTRRYESLWRTRLRNAFPGAGLRREILEPLTNLHLWLADDGTDEAAHTPTAADLAAAASRLETVIADGEPERAKALLRILIAELRVNGRHDIQPTYRMIASDRTHTAATSEKWAVQESNLQPWA